MNSDRRTSALEAGHARQRVDGRQKGSSLFGSGHVLVEAKPPRDGRAPAEPPVAANGSVRWLKSSAGPQNCDLPWPR